MRRAFLLFNIHYSFFTIKTARIVRYGRIWWKRVDSDHRSETQQIYSLPPLATRERFQRYKKENGAGGRTRTPDLLITNQLLYQLSYTSAFDYNIISHLFGLVKCFFEIS